MAEQNCFFEIAKEVRHKVQCRAFLQDAQDIVAELELKFSIAYELTIGFAFFGHGSSPIWLIGSFVGAELKRRKT
jgi:hypothetical protein